MPVTHTHTHTVIRMLVGCFHVNVVAGDTSRIGYNISVVSAHDLLTLHLCQCAIIDRDSVSYGATWLNSAAHSSDNHHAWKIHAWNI